MDTLVEKPDQLSSGQGKIQEKSELEKAFDSAMTSEEMLKAFKDMESDRVLFLESGRPTSRGRRRS